MGQKTSSISLRLGINRTWLSKWFEINKNYASLLHEDIKIRDYINNLSKNYNLHIGQCQIKRSWCKLVISLEVYIENHYKDNVLKSIEKEFQIGLTKLTKTKVLLTIIKIDNYTDSAQLVANYISHQIEKRRSYKEVVRRILQEVKQDKRIKGIRISCSGRLDGVEIARTEWQKEGQLPLHMLKAYIDYAKSIAYTTYGVCGIKVWICYK